MIGEDNRSSSLSLKRIKLPLDSLPRRFGVDVDFPLSKVNTIDIPYMLLYTTMFFSVIY